MVVSNNFTNTKGFVHRAVGICARCNLRVPYDDLREDGDVPGLWVCQSEGCWDQISPYKLPSHPQDVIALDHARPDVPLTVTPTESVTWDSTTTTFDDDHVTFDQT